MSKKKDKSKGKKTFTKLLAENAKKIKWMSGEEEMNVADWTSATIDAIATSTMEGMVGASASEAAENAVPGTRDIVNLAVSYARPVYSLYEAALKYNDVKQSMVITLPADELDTVFDGTLERKYGLDSKSNLGMILPEFPNKLKKRAFAWADEEDDSKNPSILVITIPDILLFYGELRKDEPANVKYFNLVINVVRTTKSLNKLRNKRPEEFASTMNYIIESTCKIIKELGLSCVHMPLDDTFFNTAQEYASVWCKTLSNDYKRLVTRITFCAPTSDIMVAFSNQVLRELTDVNDLTLV